MILDGRFYWLEQRIREREGGEGGEERKRESCTDESSIKIGLTDRIMDRVSPFDSALTKSQTFVRKHVRMTSFFEIASTLLRELNE